MRARLVLITALSGAALLAGACQPESTGSQQSGPPETPSPRRTTTEAGSSTASATASAGASPTTVRTVFDRQAMQTSVLRLLEDDYGIEQVQQVSCPPGEQVVDGNTFSCTTVIGGQEKRVGITVTGDEGEYVVSRPE